MKTITTAAALTLALLAAAVPAAAQNREHVQMAAELRMLQEQQVQLSLKMDQLTQALTEAMKALDSRLDQAGAAVTKGFADQALTLRNLGDDLRAVRATSQDTTTRLGELREEVEALRGSVTSLLTRSTSVAPTFDPLDPNALPPDPLALPVDPPPASIAGLSPNQVFMTAWSDYGAGQYTLAIAGFEQFIRTFGATSERADDAQFYIGEAEFAQNRFDDAIAAYNQVIQNYPTGDQVAWAYYKRGLALRRLKRLDEARASLEQAIKLGNNEAAALAKQQLDGLLREAAAQPPAQ